MAAAGFTKDKKIINSTSIDFDGDRYRFTNQAIIILNLRKHLIRLSGFILLSQMELCNRSLFKCRTILEFRYPGR